MRKSALVMLLCSIVVLFVIPQFIPMVYAVKTITYNGSYIQAVGGDADNPITFYDLYEADISGGWFMVECYNAIQYKINCRIVIGDYGTTTTYFNDTNKQITFADDSALSGQSLIYVTENSYLTFGTLIDEEKKITQNGISIFDAEDYNAYTRIISGYYAPHGQINLYSCYFSGDNLDLRHYISTDGTPSRIWNCEGNNVAIFSFDNLDLFNWLSTNRYYGLMYGSSGGTYNRINILNEGYSEAIYLYLQYAINISNLYCRGSNGLIKAGGITQDSYLIDADSDTWVINWDVGSTAKIWRQYTFNLIATYPNGTKIVNATVLISNSVQGIVFNGTTDSNGNIPEQILTMGFYNITGGSTLYSYNPFWVNATSQDGKYIYYKSWDMHNLANWEIALLPLTTIESSFPVGFVGGSLLVGCIALVGVLAVKKRS